MIDGIEATIDPVVFHASDGPRSGIRAVFSNGAPELAGQVLDERQAPTSAYRLDDALAPIMRDGAAAAALRQTGARMPLAEAIRFALEEPGRPTCG